MFFLKNTILLGTFTLSLLYLLTSNDVSLDAIQLTIGFLGSIVILIVVVLKVFNNR